MKDKPVPSFPPPIVRLPQRPEFLPITDASEGHKALGGLAPIKLPSVHRVNQRRKTLLHQSDLADLDAEAAQIERVSPHIAFQPGIENYTEQPTLMVVSVDQSGKVREGNHIGGANGGWTTGIPGLASAEYMDEFQQHSTLPMMVLKNIATQQGQPVPAMQSEVSGAAGAAAIVGIGNIGANILKYISSLIIQHGFGPGLFGLYSVGMSVVTLVASVFNLGLDDAMVRYTSIYRGKKQARSLLGLTIFCTLITGIMGMLGAFVVLFMAPFFAQLKHSPGVVPLLQVMSPIVPFLCMQVIWSGGLQGFKAFKWRMLSQRIIPAIVLIILLMGVFLVLRNKQKDQMLIGVAMATLISTIVGVILELYFLFRMVSRLTQESSEAYEIREWLGFATPNFLTAIVDTVLESVDTLLLVFYAVSNVAIGQYSAALKISTFISVPLLSLNAMFAPTIAELHSKGEMQKLVAMFKTVTKWSITLSLPIFLVVTVFSVPLLGISGPGFIPAWSLLVALSVGNLGNTVTGSVGNMLLMTGHQKLSFLNSLTAVVVNVVLGIILTPHFGAMGTAISTGLAFAVVNAMRLIQVRLLLKIQPYNWDVFKPIGAGAISAALIGGVLYLLSDLHLSIHIGHSDISIELLLIPVFLVVYGWLLSLFKLSDDDRVVVDRFRKKFISNKAKKQK